MQIINHMPRPYGVGKTRLMPGPNTLSPDDAQKFLAHKTVKGHVEAGRIVVQKSAMPKVAAQKQPEMTVEQIAASQDKEALQKIADGDGRKPETKAAKERLEALG